MSNDYTYGEAKEVAERLMAANCASTDDLLAALINALRRIAALEHQVAGLKQDAGAPT